MNYRKLTKEEKEIYEKRLIENQRDLKDLDEYAIPLLELEYSKGIDIAYTQTKRKKEHELNILRNQRSEIMANIIDCTEKLEKGVLIKEKN